MKKLYTLEYSKKQRCFHEDELDRTLNINWRKLINDKDNDWTIIGVFETMQEADDFFDKYCKPIKEKWYERDRKD